MKKIISITLISTIMATVTITTPMTLFAKEEKLEKEEQKALDVKYEGNKLGEELGKKQGRADGRRDFINGSKYDWEKAYEKLGNISPPINPSGSNDYLIGYKEGFKKGFEKGYYDAILELWNEETEVEIGYEAGTQIGNSMGQAAGEIDFITPNKKNDWSTSLMMFEQKKSIVDRYFLNRESQEYKESFITGFRESYRLAYKTAYQESNIDIAENNINYVKIAAKGDTLEFKPSDGVGNLGGTLTVQPATFYQETYLGVSMDRDSFNYQNLKYKPINHIYNVAVSNASSSIVLEKPLTLELEYYGSERAGIYQLVKGEWRYLNTIQSEGLLTAKIPEGHFRGGKYAIFVDQDYIPIRDIKGHWASEELYTFLRRGYIEGFKNEEDKDKFYPETTMKRAHFMELLGKTLGWNYENIYDNTSKFKDQNEFGRFRDSINYASNMGYISGHTDGSFKPWDTITYQQVEWIMRSIMRDEKFSWDQYERDILINKHTAPKSIGNRKASITRGEAVYMLYEIQRKNLM